MYSNVFSCYPFHFIVDLYYFCIFCFINYIVYCYIVVVNKLKLNSIHLFEFVRELISTFLLQQCIDLEQNTNNYDIKS